MTVENAVFQGKTILFTGTLLLMNRKVAQEMAEKAGAQNISAVSKNLNILVVGENAGSKLTKAKEIGSVQIFTEEEFISELKEAGLY
jgi:DNA ligase (NAD+)